MSYCHEWSLKPIFSTGKDKDPEQPCWHPTWGEGSHKGGRGIGKWEAVKTTCLPFNNLAGCLEETQQNSQQKGRVGAKAFSPQQGEAGWKAACWETQQVQGAEDQCADQSQGRVPHHSCLCVCLSLPSTLDGTLLLPNWLDRQQR